MDRVLQDLEPQKVFYYFEEISRIPHGSGNEKALSDYIVSFARARGYHTVQDTSWNVVVDIPATPGLEERKKIILQGHIDMVCQKVPGSSFDFKTQPLSLYIEDGYIRAKDTTLGADDGFAVAMLLAIMDSPELPHAPLQMIFTTGEEIFLTGARALDGQLLDGAYFIGLDCSQDDIIMVSCAGLSISHFYLAADRVPYTVEGKRVFSLTLDGLLGGHSGNMIHLGRANAIKVLSEVLAEVMESIPCELLSIQGGTVPNAIPAQAHALISCAAEDADKLEDLLAAIDGKLKAAFRRTDSALHLDVAQADAGENAAAIAPDQVKRLIQMLDVMFTGAHTIIDDAFTLAESSCNIGVLKETDGKIEVVVSLRSNSEYLHDNLLRKLYTVAGAFGFDANTENRVISWEYRPDSVLRERMGRIYEELNGARPTIKKIHASVEAVEFIAKMKQRGLELDLVNIGCRNLDCHTPNERLEIASVGKTYRLLTRVISALD